MTIQIFQPNITQKLLTHMLIITGYVAGTADEANAGKEKYKPYDTASADQF